MDRRSFMAGCAGLSLSAKAGGALAQSGPLTKIIFPFAAGGSGDALCRIAGAAPRSAARSQFHRREPHRRRRADRDQGGQGRQSRRHHDPGHDWSDHVPAADGGDQPSFDAAKDFVPVSQLARFEFAHRGEPCDRSQRLQAAGGLAEGQRRTRQAMEPPAAATSRISWVGDLNRLLGMSMTRVPYRGSALIVNDLIGGHRAVRHHHRCGRDRAASGRRVENPGRQQRGAFAVRCLMCRP